MNYDIKCSSTLKVLSYIFIPVFIIVIILSAIYTEYISSYSDYTSKDLEFYQTSRFAEMYKSNIMSALYDTQNKTGMFDKANVEENIYYNEYYDYTESNIINYLIINTQTNKAYTNILLTSETDSISKLKENIKNDNNKYLCYNTNTNTIETNMENDELKNIKYTYLGNYLEENSKYEIYTYYNENANKTPEMIFEQTAFNLTKTLGWLPVIAMPILCVLVCIMVIYLFFATGHKKGYNGIYLNKFEKWPIEVIGFLAICAFMFVGVMLQAVLNTNIIQLGVYLSILTIIGLIAYITFLILVTIIVKKIKTSTLINSSLTYKIVKKIISILKNLWNTLFDNVDINLKIAILFVCTILISIILISTGVLGVFLVLAFWSYILYRILKKVNQFRKIKETTKEIYEGKVDLKINEEEVDGELKELSKYINDVAGGFSNAIEQNLKAERLKTELITNVSHDIKTPLTSIINYVDLLKQENIQNEKANEYIQILDNKSQRLKKLTEDLIEASKVSSGNVKLNIEKIDVVELINQTVGEFKERFEEKKLDIILNMPDSEVNIKADSRYMYRVIENIYSNIAKYALDNSRVYIDVKVDGNKVVLNFKNISKEKLNISIDEIMERFVRGDKSRTTEGSGLGISISKSLTELQKGKFDIQVDGDLFKVELEFDIIQY